MGLIASDTGGGELQLAPAGAHRAICYLVADVGTHNGPYGAKHQMVVGWELTDELMEDRRPFAVSKFYTLSLAPKAGLKADLESWRGRPFTTQELEGFDLSKLLGAPALVTVVHKENKQGSMRAIVSSVTSLPKSMKKPTPFNPVACFDLDEPTAAEDINKLPEWIQNKVRESSEWAAKGQFQEHGMPSAERDIDSDLPF